MSFRLDGHVAFVTGSSRGLGKDVAMTLGRAGAKVAFNYLNNPASGEATFEEFKAAGALTVSWVEELLDGITDEELRFLQTTDLVADTENGRILILEK